MLRATGCRLKFRCTLNPVEAGSESAEMNTERLRCKEKGWNHPPGRAPNLQPEALIPTPTEGPSADTSHPSLKNQIGTEYQGP